VCMCVLCVCACARMCVCDMHVKVLGLVLCRVLCVQEGLCMSKRDRERVCLGGRGRESVYVCLCTCACVREKLFVCDNKRHITLQHSATHDTPH